jgi:hypothetical protein
MRTLLTRLGCRSGLRVCAVGFIATLAISTTAHAGVIWAVDSQDNLFDFDNTTPNNVISGHTISGLASNEQILQIDFRPADGNLYGLSSQNRIYQLNTTNGAATFSQLTPLMNGNHFGFDISPVTDTSRVVSDADQNMRINMSNGIPAVDTTLSYAAGDPNQLKNPSVVALGYSNDLPAANSTTLYGIDTNLDTLVTINPEDAGILHTVGSLGVDATGLTGMDIATNPPAGPNAGDVAFANIELPGSSVSDLYAINLATGHATDEGQIIDGVQVRDIAAELGETFIVPEPASAMLLLAAGGMLVGRRRAAR